MIKKILAILLVINFIAMPCYSINDWIRGDGSDAIKGTDNPSDIDANTTNYIQDPLDRLLATYINGCTLTRTSATVITVSAGEVACSNGAGTIKRFRQNTSTVTMTITTSGVGGLDTGAEATSTWYHIYANADADATTFTVIASTSASAPTGVTYYKYLGSVYNDSAGDLKNFYWFGEGNIALIMWDVPVSVATAASSGAWSSAVSCSTAMPSTSTYAIFGIGVVGGASPTAIWIRRNGSTWAVDKENGLYHDAVPTAGIGSHRTSMTDGSQQIQYYSAGTTTSVAIDLEGYYINR